MKITKYISTLVDVSIIKSLYYNFFCRHVKRNNSFIVVYKKAKLYFEKGSILQIENGIFQFGRLGGGRFYSNLRLQHNGKMYVKGPLIIEYGADILIKENAKLKIEDNSYINCKVMIRCHKNIQIGRNVLISSGVDIRDSDGHYLEGKICNTSSVKINNHVWICSNVRILKGVTIGSGTIIGCSALVTRSIPDNSLAYGVPAVVKKSNIMWER